MNWFKVTKTGENDWMYFGGTTNYIQGTGTDVNLLIDWTNTDKELGFVTAWSDNLNCLT